jgi:hypothetical protein
MVTGPPYHFLNYKFEEEIRDLCYFGILRSFEW